MPDLTQTHNPSAPDGHVVGDDRDALRSPLLGWLYDIAGVDAEWSICAADEFTWWPGKLAQRVKVLPAPAGGLTRLLAATHLLNEVPDPVNARQLLSKLNAGAAGYVFHLSQDETQVWVSTSHCINEKALDTKAIIAFAAIAQAIVADQVAHVLAEALGAVVAASAHPRNGARIEPDQMLNLITEGWARPEPVLTSAITIADIQALAQQVAAMMGTTIGDGLGQITMARDGRTFEVALRFDQQVIPSIAGDRPAHLVVGLEAHPDFGDTFAVILASPLVVGPEHLATAERLADTLNQAATGPQHDGRTALGAWWSRGGQLCWSAYVPLGFAAALKPVGSPRRTEQLAALVNDLAGQRCADLIEAAFAFPLCATKEPAPWRGLSFAPNLALTVYPQRASGHAAMAQHLIEDPDSVLDVTLADLGPRPDIALGTWGIFNPAGPTLTTLGLIHTNGGWLLAEWMRHPTAPLFRIHALLRDDEPDTVTRACERVLVEGYGDRERCPVPDGLPEFVLLAPAGPLAHIVPAALRRIGQTRCDTIELTDEAAIYRFFGGDPWARMNATYQQYQAICAGLPDATPAQAAQAWWSAASDAEHVSGHAMAFGGAWDGVGEFLKRLANGNP